MTPEEQAHAAGHPLLGTKVGSYRITRELARGGMGVVFEAVHESLGQRAAVKVLADELIQDPNYALYADRFFTEAKAISIIQHPGIVKLYDHGKLPGGTVFIMMEFLDGQTLASLIEQGGQRGPRQPWIGFQKCVGITRQVASALAEAHKKSILHRDLKPGEEVREAEPVPMS